MRRILGFIALAAALSGCDSTGPETSRIRVANTSDLAYEQVELTVGAEVITFGTIAAGQTTSYRSITARGSRCVTTRVGFFGTARSARS